MIILLCQIKIILTIKEKDKFLVKHKKFKDNSIL
jgi:hypothetical protein